LVDLLLTVLLVIPLYLLPGYLMLWVFDTRGLGQWTRLFLSLCTSLVVVPVSFIFVGNVFHFIPGLFSYLFLLVFLVVLGLALRRLKRRPLIQMPEMPSPASKVELIVAWVAIFLYAIICNLPRLAMFVQGEMTLSMGTFDETWHLAQLVSVARTGIPPAHYFFPDIKLVYYYASWIYPAVLGNLPFMQVSLARAMAIHAFIQIFAFLGLVYCLLRYNFRTWWVRLVGLSFFSIMGGFDLFVLLPTIKNIDWWQGNVGWMVSNIEITQFTTLYAWVPQYLAGGMSFLLGLLLMKNLRAAWPVKAVVLGLLFSICFLTSPFVFISFVLVLVLAVLFNLKYLLRHWKGSLGIIMLIGLTFLLVAWYPLILYAGHNNGFGWRNFRLTVLESLWPTRSWSIVADRALALLGFPLLAGWIGVIEIGLPFILYLVWLLKGLFSTRRAVPTTEAFLMAVFPSVFLFVIFLVVDENGGGNLAMRGMIPAQILINFAALSFLENVHEQAWHPAWRRWLFIYLFACFFVAQGLSSYAEIYSDGRDPVRTVIHVDLGPRNTPDWQSGVGTPWLWPAPLAYIHWLNQHTPPDALVIEDGCPLGDADALQFRWLERERFMDPLCVSKIDIFNYDKDFISPSEWTALLGQASKYPNVLSFYEATEHSASHRPVYYVDRNGTSSPGWGPPVYRDGYVSIYQVS
jgi:hypothetical protein